MGLQGLADLRDHAGDAAGIVGSVEMADDMTDLLIPEGLAYFLMDPLVAVNSQLTALQGDIHEDRIPGGSLLHLQAGENLGGPIECIHIPAAMLDIYADLATGLLLGFADSSNDLFLFGRRKQFLF